VAFEKLLSGGKTHSPFCSYYVEDVEIEIWNGDLDVTDDDDSQMDASHTLQFDWK